MLDQLIIAWKSISAGTDLIITYVAFLSLPRLLDATRALTRLSFPRSSSFSGTRKSQDFTEILETVFNLELSPFLSHRVPSRTTRPLEGHERQNLKSRSVDCGSTDSSLGLLSILPRDLRYVQPILSTSFSHKGGRVLSLR